MTERRFVPKGQIGVFWIWRTYDMKLLADTFNLC